MKVTIAVYNTHELLHYLDYLVEKLFSLCDRVPWVLLKILFSSSSYLHDLVDPLNLFHGQKKDLKNLVHLFLYEIAILAKKG